jgi:hypothetical protein
MNRWLDVLLLAAKTEVSTPAETLIYATGEIRTTDYYFKIPC